TGLFFSSRRRHPRSKRDWSSDVCSSDLDLSSLLASEFTEVKSGMAVLDSCSAPGGKATAMAEAMDNTGDIYAYDLHKNKTKLIRSEERRVGKECTSWLCSSQ